MKSKLILVSMMTLLVSACGKTNNDVAFTHEKSSSSLALVDDQQRPEGKTCESEQDLRAKGKAEFVCLYEGLNYTGEACCVARENNARFVQVPDSNPRSRSAASLVHFGFKGALGVVDTARVYSDLDLLCVTSPNQSGLQPTCRGIPPNDTYGASFGIWGSINRLASYSYDNDPTLRFFGIKTLVFELENLDTSAPRQ